MLVLARVLAPSDIGVIVTALTMLSILTSVTELSLSSALVYHRNPDQTHFATVWTLNAVRGLSLGLLYAACSIPAQLIYADERLPSVMLALSLGLVIGGLQNPFTISLNKKLIFWQDFVLQVSGKVVSVAVSLTIGFMYHSYWALVAGGIAGQFVTVVVSYVILRYRPSISFHHVRELFSFSAWLTLGQLVTSINWNFDNLLVGAIIGSSTLGLYAVGHAFAGIATREALTPLVSVFFPTFATFRDEPDRMAEAYYKAQSIVVAVGLPVGIGLAAVARPLVPLLLGEHWSGTVPIIQCLAPMYALQTISAIAAPVAMATGHTRLLFIRDVQGFAIRLPLIAAGLGFYGLPGLLAAQILSGVLLIPLGLAVAYRAIKANAVRQLVGNFRSFVAAAMMLTMVLGLDAGIEDALAPSWQFLRLVVLVSGGALTYVCAHTIVWILLGRPTDGPENEIRRAVEALRSRFG